MLKGIRNRYAHNVIIAIESLKGNRLQSLLTGLGIMFGVAAVISMLAIGSGARQEILEQMKLIGVNNIIVNALDPNEPQPGEQHGGGGTTASVEQQGAAPTEAKTSSNGKERRRFSPGLTLRDAEAIANVVPAVQYATGVVTYGGEVLHGGRKLQAQIKGVERDYFSIYGLRVGEGNLFSSQHMQSGDAVCVIGSQVRAKLFSGQEAVGQLLKFHDVWYRVIGVLTSSGATAESSEDTGLGISDYNSTVFIPLQTLTVRWHQRGQMAKSSGVPSGSVISSMHEVDQIVVHVEDADRMRAVENVIERMLSRRHQGVRDYRVVVPEQLLKQQQRTRDIFNLVLGAIAGISLLVGGIGIMNIMFATVMERTREIGTRRAIGAKQSDIISQFLAEAVLISVLGGLMGVLLGVGLSLLISHLADIATVVTWQSILLSFGVSATVGIIFGFSPARRAAMRSPIESLRYE